MFVGSSAFLASFIMLVAPVLIAVAEAPGAYRWLARRRLDPLLHPELLREGAFSAPARPIGVDGLLDPCPTEPLILSPVLREALASNKPPPACHAPVEEAVLVGGGPGPETRVRPSIREPRS